MPIYALYTHQLYTVLLIQRCTASICLLLINVSVTNLKEPGCKWKRVMFHSGLIMNPTAFLEKNRATLTVIGRETQLKVS